MTDREKAIVMAYTGVCMLTGNKFRIFHEYVEDIMGRPIQTIEMGMGSVADEIKEKARPDFLKLCEEDQEQCGDCISRQEVEDAIYDYSRSCDVNYAQIMEFIDKLPSVTPQPCDDAVSRQAVLDLVADYDLSMGQVVKGIHALPSVTPQPKTGRLILLDECSNSGYYCSECQKKVVKEGWSNTVKKIKYCPNCGANMSEIPTVAEGSEE